MLTNPPCRSPSTRIRGLRAAALLATVLLPGFAHAAPEWHADLATAQAASRISRRPVLAVFVAAWSPEAAAVETSCLGSPEAEAVLATCFEPVRIDIDAEPAVTRSAGVTHVPTACVLAADGTALASFQMPGSPAAFVTVAILAAQRAGTAEHEGDAAVARGPQAAPEPPDAPTAAAFGFTSDTGAMPQRPTRGSLARVTAKVRDLSAFALGQGRSDADPAPVALAQASRTISRPEAGYQPLAWPAEPATAPPTAVAPSPAIEPASSPLTPTTVAPWLESAAAPGPATTATPAPLPPSTPEPAPAPPQSGVIAALQKPFGIFGKAAPEPPTMPPALPSHRAAAETAHAPPQPADAHGSMPLGLEGYCPVSLVDRGTWVEGRAQWGARHRGRTYLFAGQDEQRTFLADPDRYAPALSGDDPVLALDGGSCTPGQRRYGVTYQSRMYLFATPETRSAFTADPGRYAARIVVAERIPASGSRTY